MGFTGTTITELISGTTQKCLLVTKKGEESVVVCANFKCEADLNL